MGHTPEEKEKVLLELKKIMGHREENPHFEERVPGNSSSSASLLKEIFQVRSLCIPRTISQAIAEGGKTFPFSRKFDPISSYPRGRLKKRRAPPFLGSWSDFPPPPAVKINPLPFLIPMAFPLLLLSG